MAKDDLAKSVDVGMGYTTVLSVLSVDSKAPP